MHDVEIVGDEAAINEEALADVPKIYTPPHMEGRELVRAGVLLPFTDRRAGVRDQSEGMLAAIELALFDHAGLNVVLLPKDSAGDSAQAAAMAETLRDEGADFVLGPLFGASVISARDVLSPEGVPLIAFSNDAAAAGGGAWLASIAPEAEVTEIIDYAISRGYDSFAFFGPQNSLGEQVERTMQFEVARHGAQMIAARFYPADAISPDIEAADFARNVEAAVKRGQRVAVLVPERGTKLRRIAPLLAYHGVDTRQVRMLGLASWNDPSIWREPSLNGAWFPAPPPLEVIDFDARYERQYGRPPSSLAAIAYDAAALAIALSDDGDLTTEELTNRDGFAGVNGLFRFRYDGTAERSLAIMQIDPLAERGVTEIRPVASGFDPSTS